MAVRTCDHLKEDGVYCNSPALKGRNYCYFHLNIRGRRLNMARARALGPEQPLNVPFPEDMHAVQVTLFEVVSALAHKRIEERNLHGVHVLGEGHVQWLFGAEGAGTSHVEAASADIQVKVAVIAALQGR